jgi:Zn-dependent protease with chaperone function
LIAVIGIIRPRLFVANQVFDTLTAEELSAALQHEAGHLAARDNLKRALMRVCRDMLLLVPFGKNLDREWLEATESAADDHATCFGGHSHIDLASALVKIARLVPAGVRPAVPAGAFLFNDEASTGFRSRVRRLLQVERVPYRRRSTGGFKWVVLAVLILAAVLFVDHSQVLFNSHGLTERLVHLLS